MSRRPPMSTRTYTLFPYATRVRSYHQIGGHAYGWVYPGPMGVVLTPALIGIDEATLLPNASTFCGKCEEVCPVRIPLPKMMRHWREREFERHLAPDTARYGLKAWTWLATRPRLYRLATAVAAGFLGGFGRRRGRLDRKSTRLNSSH